MNDTLKRLRMIVEDKAAEMGWEPDDVLALAASAFARGNPILDADKLRPFQNYEALTGKLVADTIRGFGVLAARLGCCVRRPSDRPDGDPDGIRCDSLRVRSVSLLSPPWLDSRLA
jgi:hypothetical protein